MSISLQEKVVLLAWTAYSRLHLEARTVELLRGKCEAEVPNSKEEILRNSLANISQENSYTFSYFHVNNTLSI